MLLGLMVHSDYKMLNWVSFIEINKSTNINTKNAAGSAVKHSPALIACIILYFMSNVVLQTVVHIQINIMWALEQLVR